MRGWITGVLTAALLLAALPLGATQLAGPTQPVVLNAACTSAPCSQASADQVQTPGGNGACSFNVSGTFSGTITFESTNDNGVTWYALAVLPSGVGQTATTTATSAFLGSTPYLATSYVRARMSAYVSGAASVFINCTASSVVYNSALHNAASGLYDALILREPTLIHYYPMNESSGTTLHDYVGSANLTIVSGGSGAAGINVNAGAIIPDNESSVRFPNNDNPVAGGGSGPLNYISVPAAAWSGLTSAFTFEILLADGWAGRGNEGYVYSGFPILASFTASGQGFEIYLASSRPTTNIDIGGASSGVQSSYFMPDVPALCDLVSDGTYAYLYVNGSLAIKEAITSLTNFGPPLAAGYLGLQLSSDYYPWQGRVAKMAVYSSALSQTDIETHVAALQ